MKQYEPCIQNDDNINNNNNNNKKEKKSKGGEESVGRMREMREIYILIFFSFCFFLRSTKIEP